MGKKKKHYKVRINQLFNRSVANGNLNNFRIYYKYQLTNLNPLEVKEGTKAFKVFKVLTVLIEGPSSNIF